MQISEIRILMIGTVGTGSEAGFRDVNSSGSLQPQSQSSRASRGRRAWIFLAALRAGVFFRDALRGALLSSRSLSAALRATLSLTLERSFFDFLARGRAVLR